MNWNSLGTSIFATGLGMTILNKFGNIWRVVKNFMKIGYSIYASTENQYIEYVVLTNYIRSLNSKAVNKRTAYDVKIYDHDTKVKLIGSGTYLISTSFLQCMVVDICKIVKQNNDVPNYSMNISIYGLHGHDRYNEIIKLVNKHASNNKQRITNPNNFLTYIEPKSFDNIYHQKKDMIIEYLDNFKKIKSLYNKNGIIYKTGILLYGPPGTGKTSMVRAIANYMNYPIQIGMYNHDNMYRSSNEVVVFEEIDKLIKEVPDSKSSKENDPLRNIMQILDGLGSTEGVIYIATTNNIDALPEQLIRDGRFDLKVELGDIDKENAIAMCNSFDVKLEDVVSEDQTFPINPSYLQNLILNKVNKKKDIKLT